MRWFVQGKALLRSVVMAGALAGATILAPGAAQAATVLKVDVAESARLSEWVVRARVVSLTTVDQRATGDSIYTDVTLQIDAVYRGGPADPGVAAPRTIVMRLMGGVGGDGLALTVPGMPSFAIGEEAVLFLERTGKGLVPCGLEQGVWRIAPSVTGVPVVWRNLGNLSLMEKAADGKLVPSGPARPAGVKLLAELEREIRAAK